MKPSVSMRSHITSRLRSSSLSAVPPPRTSRDYSPALARFAASILYSSPLSSPSGNPLYILNAAALPDSSEVDYDALLPYVLARLPGEDELLGGKEYEVVFFAGGGAGGAAGDDASGGGRKGRPGWGWFVQAYHVLSRAMRKRIKRLYIVHERSWVRVLTEVFSTIVSPKFRRKITHVSTLSGLAGQIPLENLLIPPSAYLHDKRVSPGVQSPESHGKRAFSTQTPLPKDYGGQSRLPRVLRETTTFLLYPQNITTEGLFRIPAHAKLKEALRESYERGQKFLVWKENGVTLPIPDYDGVENLDAIIAEVDTNDAYSVHMAAGLCKLWYSELKQPVFPTESYHHLRSNFGSNDPQAELSVERLLELIKPKSEWSVLPATSREILTRHLLPLLSAVASHEESNKMTADNLAVCFAPTLLCGPDQLEDVKMSSIIRRILTFLTENWETTLREGCGVKSEAFEQDLKPPDNIEDYEDPLEEFGLNSAQGGEHSGASTSQFTGIIMQDKDCGTTLERAPTLPPRPKGMTSPTTPSSAGESAAPRRKPAPPTVVPPRYSTIVSDEPYDLTESPIGATATADGFGPPGSMANRMDSTASGSYDVPESSIGAAATADGFRPPGGIATRTSGIVRGSYDGDGIQDFYGEEKGSLPPGRAPPSDFRLSKSDFPSQDAASVPPNLTSSQDQNDGEKSAAAASAYYENRSSYGIDNRISNPPVYQDPPRYSTLSTYKAPLSQRSSRAEPPRQSKGSISELRRSVTIGAATSPGLTNGIEAIRRKPVQSGTMSKSIEGPIDEDSPSDVPSETTSPTQHTDPMSAPASASTRQSEATSLTGQPSLDKSLQTNRPPPSLTSPPSPLGIDTSGTSSSSYTTTPGTSRPRASTTGGHISASPSSITQTGPPSHSTDPPPSYLHAVSNTTDTTTTRRRSPSFDPSRATRPPPSRAVTDALTAYASTLMPPPPRFPTKRANTDGMGGGGAADIWARERRGKLRKEPRRLDMRSPSVEELRALYAERARFASDLAAVGRERRTRAPGPRPLLVPAPAPGPLSASSPTRATPAVATSPAKPSSEPASKTPTSVTATATSEATGSTTGSTTDNASRGAVRLSAFAQARIASAQPKTARSSANSKSRPRSTNSGGSGSSNDGGGLSAFAQARIASAEKPRPKSKVITKPKPGSRSDS